MDAHSGGMSGSTSYSKLVKTSFESSIRRPVVRSGSLEHQLAPAIQQGSYRHAPLDHIVNSLDHLLGTNDHAHRHSPSSSLVDNINHHLAPRTLNTPRQPPAHIHNELTSAGLGFAIAVVLIIGGIITVLLPLFIYVWATRRRQDRKARNADIEAARRADSALPADGANANAPLTDPDAPRPGLASRLQAVFARNPFHNRNALASTPANTESAEEAIELSEKRGGGGDDDEDDGRARSCHTSASSGSSAATSPSNAPASPSRPPQTQSHPYTPSPALAARIAQMKAKQQLRVSEMMGRAGAR